MTEKLPLCECGCGEPVTKSGNRFIVGHWLRLNNPMDNEKSRKKHLETTTSDEFRDNASNRQISRFDNEPELKKRISKSVKEYHAKNPISDVTRNLMSVGQTEHYLDHPERVAKQRDAKNRYYDDIENHIIQSCRMQGIPRDEFGGFIGDSQEHDWSKAIYLNDIFPGCARHHITKTIVACIPGELHRHIQHDLKRGNNMAEMNMLALQYINGGL